jgi:hypothetical protein
MRFLALLVTIAAVTVNGAATNGTARHYCFDLPSGTIVCPPIKALVEPGCVELLSGTVVC